MAGSSRITIAEVEEIVEPGKLNPEEIIVPGIYVDRVFIGERFEKIIQRPTFDDSQPSLFFTYPSINFKLSYSCGSQEVKNST